MTGLANENSQLVVPQILPEVSLTPEPWINRIEHHPAWGALSSVPESMTALIALKGFTVRSLLLLEEGQIIESTWGSTEDIPIKIGNVQIAWGEFEVVEHTLALRVTRLA